MKTKIFLGCIMAASLITVSCSDLLQENPQGKLTPEGYFSTQEELDMSVYSLYSKVNYSQTRTNPQYPQWREMILRPIREVTSRSLQKLTVLLQ